MAETLDLRRTGTRCGECGLRFGADAMFCPFDGTKLAHAAWDPAGDPLLRRVIDGRYEIVGVLGEGGMGTVYQVRHTSLDRFFAMKVLRRDLARDSDLAARFLREARATASVKHPSIVAINDFGTIDGTLPYFVMENLVGQTLAHTIKTGGALPAALGVRIAVRVAGALGAAHAERVVHRDLKPDNVFLLGAAPTGGDVDLRVVDFGAALILGASRVTKAGIVFGTPQYMSPEQASGQPVDHRADVYALGVIMYEMFTGRVPFIADTYMGVLTQHMFVKPVPPSQVSERARELGALEGVVLRALEKKPEHRYESMAALADDIERVSSFGTDGSLKTARASAGAPSRPVFSLANALEPVTREEVNASATTHASVRRRRARARAWIACAGMAVGLAGAAFGVARALAPGGDGTRSPPLASVRPPQAPPLASASPPVSVPIPVAIPLPPEPLAAPSPPSVAPISRQRARQLRPPLSPAASASGRPAGAKVATPAPGDFADPWAK